MVANILTFFANYNPLVKIRIKKWQWQWKKNKFYLPSQYWKDYENNGAKRTTKEFYFYLRLNSFSNDNKEFSKKLQYSESYLSEIVNEKNASKQVISKTCDVLKFSLLEKTVLHKLDEYTKTTNPHKKSQIEDEIYQLLQKNKKNTVFLKKIIIVIVVFVSLFLALSKPVQPITLSKLPKIAIKKYSKKNYINNLLSLKNPNDPVTKFQIDSLASQYKLKTETKTNPSLVIDGGDISFFYENFSESNIKTNIKFLSMYLVLEAADETQTSIINKGDLGFCTDEVYGYILNDYKIAKKYGK